MPSKEATSISISTANCIPCRPLILSRINFCQSSGWKMIFYFNFLIICQLQPIFIYWLGFFFYELPICSFVHFVCYLNSRIYIIKAPIFLWHPLCPYGCAGDWGAEPGHMGEKGEVADLGLRFKKIRKSFGCQERERIFTEYLLRAKYNTNCKLPSCEEGGYYYHFSLSFCSSEKPRFKEIKRHAQGRPGTERQSQAMNTDPPNSKAPAGPTRTAHGSQLIAQ